MRIGDVVVSHGVPRAEVEGAAATSKVEGRRIGEILMDRGLVDERELARALAERWQAPFDDAEQLFSSLDPTLLKKLPRKFVEQIDAVPLRFDGDELVIATSDPTLDLREIARGLDAKRMRMVVVTRTDVRRLRAAVDLGELEPAAEAPKDTLHRADLFGASSLSGELVALFDSMLLDAIAQRASDLHLEIYGGRARVRFRIDGDLHDAPRYQLSREQLAGVMNVLKVSAELDIAEHRLPQGGRFTTSAGGRVFDLRIQTQPALHGEHAVVRLLPQGEKLLTVHDLGFPKPLADAYLRLMRTPAGLVLVVGPTGSGKSTTLYAGLQVLARDPTRKVITVEDPIEYALDGIQQCAARSELGFGFASAMRAFVREDPDVILVGEIRDQETALEAIRASQTGHLVLSTLHCNDAVDAVQRLRDLGMHRNSIASELAAVFAQRLARRICTECRQPATPDPELVAELFPNGLPDGFRCFKGAGCGRCAGLGVHGRIAVVEHLPVSAKMRIAITRDLALDELRDFARHEGLSSMRDHALALVQSGVIPFDELPWVTPM